MILITDETRHKMDPKDIYNFDFEPIEDDSDVESIISDEDENDTFMLADWQTGTNIFSSFEFRHYTLKKDELASKYENDIAFANTILAALNRLEHVTSIRLSADVYDLDSEEDIRWSQNIRFELSNFHSLNELKTMLVKYLKTDTAPVWHRFLTDESSDKGHNKMVKYHRTFFDFCIQKPSKSRKQVTTVCGEKEVHPGVFVKMVTDHGISYSSNDCLIQCLNEVFNLREDPDVIRKEIWGDEDYFKDLHRTRHIKYIAKRYNTKLILSDLVEQKTLVFNGVCTVNVVQLVKVGMVLGILDRIDHTVDKHNCDQSVAYFDLETVGADQRIYAFTWRHINGDLTICHNNFHDVEEQLVNKILETINSAEDNSTTIAYSWNGSRFDNWIVFKLLKKKYNKKLWIHDIIVNSGNELLTFKLTVQDGENKRHMVFKDPKKMFSVSIPEACKVFSINEGKNEFDHDEVDRCYMENSFDDYIKENRMKILDYVRQDGVLLEMITKEIAILYKKEDINMCTVLTRSVASNIAWQKTIEQHDILKDVTLSPYVEICGAHSHSSCPEKNRGNPSGCGQCRVKYNDIMDHAIGGRTQCVRKGVFENVCGIDVNSMYPYVCANREYPCGQIIELSESTLHRKVANTDVPVDKLGVYYVKIKKQHGCVHGCMDASLCNHPRKPHVVPYRRAKHYAYNWEYTGEFEKWITNVDMEQLLCGNCATHNCCVEVLKGFYWTHKTDKFYKDFMTDNYNERASIDKSDPKNMHIKLKMNGVTGSVFQHSFRELIMIFTKEELEENVKKYSELVTIIGCESINDRQYIVTMRPLKFREGDPRIKAQREFCKGAITQKPWVLTMFTYSHARKVLRDEWIRLEERGCKIIYCDTDSLFFTAGGTGHSKPMCKCCNTIVCKDEYIHRDKELGKWSIECWDDEGSFYTPKVYAIKNIGKLRIKGVGYNSLVIDTEYKNADLNYDQKLQLFLDAASNPRCDLHNDINCVKCPKRGSVHPSYRHVEDLVNGKPLKTINFIMEKSTQHGIQKKYEIKIIK